MYARADAQLGASRTTNLRAANVCLVAGIKDARSSPLLSSPLFPLPSSHLGRAERCKAGVACAGPRCLCSILRKLCRNSALVLYLLRRALSLRSPRIPRPPGTCSSPSRVILRSDKITKSSDHPPDDYSLPGGCIYDRDSATPVERANHESATEIIIFICRFLLNRHTAPRRTAPAPAPAPYHRRLLQIDKQRGSFPNRDCQFFDCRALTKGGTSCH